MLGNGRFLYIQELAARRSLPAEMQAAEMIQRHYDGEVALVFGIVTGICEVISTISSRRV